MDIVSSKKRSQMMSSIKHKNTKPELVIRKIIFNLGFRYRLNQKIGKTKPDIVLKKWNLCIFVHGCFWHQHQNCKISSKPKSNTDFWNDKLKSNVIRDQKNITELKELGWNVGVIWECFTREKNPKQQILKQYITSRTFWELGKNHNLL